MNFYPILALLLFILIVIVAAEAAAPASIEPLTTEAELAASTNPNPDPAVCAAIKPIYDSYLLAKNNHMKEIAKIVAKAKNISVYSDCMTDIDKCKDLCNPEQV